MNLKLFETKKLHYGKYLYKVVLYNSQATIFRMEFQGKNLNYARSKLDDLHMAYHAAKQKDHMIKIFKVPWRLSYEEYVKTDHFFDAINLYRILKKYKKEYKVRVEQSNASIYTNDRELVKTLINSLHTVVEFWEPDPQNIDTLSKNKNIILVDKTPKYRYKLTLGPAKGVPGLAKWIDANPNLAKAGDKAKREMYNNGFVKGYYFYVKNEKAMIFAQLLVGDDIQRIDELLYNQT